MKLKDSWEQKKLQQIKNYQLKHSLNYILMLYQLPLMLEQHGQIVNQLEKLEINHLVEVVGHLELLKLSVTESVLLLDKNFKPESQLLIYLHVVLNVEMDVTEDIQKLHGNISKKLELLPEDFIKIKLGV